MSLRDKAKEVVDTLNKLWVGQPRENIEALFISLVLRENPLIYSTPGSGKSDAIRALARMMGVRFIKIACSEGRMSLSGALYRLIISKDGNKVTYDAAFDIVSPSEYAVILLDEINRSPIELQNELLSLLEEGVLTTIYGASVSVNWRIAMTMNPYAGEIDRALLDRCITIPALLPELLKTYSFVRERFERRMVRHFSDIVDPILNGKEIPDMIKQIKDVVVPAGIIFLATILVYGLTCKKVMDGAVNLFSSVFTCDTICPFNKQESRIQFFGETITVRHLCHQVRYPPGPRAITKIVSLAKGLAWLRGKSETSIIDIVHASKFVLSKYLVNTNNIVALLDPSRLKLYAYVANSIAEYVSKKDEELLQELVSMASSDVGVMNAVVSLIRQTGREDLLKKLKW